MILTQEDYVVKGGHCILQLNIVEWEEVRQYFTLSKQDSQILYFFRPRFTPPLLTETETWASGLIFEISLGTVQIHLLGGFMQKDGP